MIEYGPIWVICSVWIFDILGVVKFIETVAGNEVNADTIDRKMFDEIQNCLENIIKKIEATNPKAAISDEPFTLWEVISGLMNLEKINLDESLQVSSRVSSDTGINNGPSSNNM